MHTRGAARIAQSTSAACTLASSTPLHCKSAPTENCPGRRLRLQSLLSTVTALKLKTLCQTHQNTTPLSCRNCTKINPWLTNRNAVQSCKHRTCELQHKPTSAMMQSRVMFAAYCSVDAVSCTRFLHHACLHRFCCFTTQQLYQASCSAGDRHAASHKRAATRTACSVAVCRHICTSAGVQQAVNI